MEKITCCAVVGLGFMGREHLSHYKKLGLRAVAVDTFLSADAAKKAGADALYQSLAEAIAAEHPQAVDICLPTPLHRSFVVEALAAGCHVLVEKPLAIEEEELDAICAAADRSSGRLMVAHVCRFMAQYRRAKAVIDEQTLGRPLSWNAWRLSATPDWSQGNWLGRKSVSGGTLYDLHIHEIDLALWLFGTPAEGHISQRGNPACPFDGHYEVRSSTRFENGVLASIDACQLMPPNYPFTSGFRLLCERGALEFNMAGTHVYFAMYDGAEKTDLTKWYRAEVLPQNPYFLEISHFLSCLESGAPFDITHTQARAAVDFTRRLSGSELLRETVK